MKENSSSIRAWLVGLLVFLTGFSAQLLGGAAWGLVTTGSTGIVQGAALALLFGWFFLPIVVAGVWAQWYLYRVARFRLIAFLPIGALSIVLALVVLFGLGPKPVGDEFAWALGYFAAGLVTVIWSMVSIILWAPFVEKV